MSIWEKENSIAKRLWETGRPGFPIYDMHGHMGTHNAIYFARSEAPEMVAHLKRIGVERLVFSHHHVIFGGMRNAAAAEICKQFPEILRMYAVVNPHFPDRVREDLAGFDRWKPYAVGLKTLPDYFQTPITDKSYEYALSFADERRLPVLCHTWGGSGCDGAALMLETARKYPNAKFFIAHSTFGDWDGAARLVNESPGNVWLELTAIPGERGIIERLVAAVGSERILFGTDLPWFDEYQAVGGVVSAEITEDDMRNILYRNADRILGPGW